MRLVTSISIVSLLVSVTSLVLVFQLFIWGRSEAPKDNSLACAELLTARAMVTWPEFDSFLLLSDYRTAQDETVGTISTIDWDRQLLECGWRSAK
jgi:hypothetical protein